jgi:hypothetical protein
MRYTALVLSNVFTAITLAFIISIHGLLAFIKEAPQLPVMFAIGPDCGIFQVPNIINYLYAHDDYELDKDNIQFIANTIFRVRKLGHEIYIIARPSDFEQVILYYDTEIDLLEFDKDCELWVENGVDPIPKKITLGRILKLTGINKIPLRSLKDGD